MDLLNLIADFFSLVGYFGNNKGKKINILELISVFQFIIGIIIIVAKFPGDSISTIPVTHFGVSIIVGLVLTIFTLWLMSKTNSIEQMTLIKFISYILSSTFFFSSISLAFSSSIFNV